MPSGKNAKHDQLYSYPLPNGDNQAIVIALKLRGGNLVDVETKDKSPLLCDIPKHISKNIWIKRGHFLIVEMYPDISNKKPDKVKAFVVRVLDADSIQNLQNLQLWPTEWIYESSPKPIEYTGNIIAQCMALRNCNRPMGDDDMEDEC